MPACTPAKQSAGECGRSVCVDRARRKAEPTGLPKQQHAFGRTTASSGVDWTGGRRIGVLLRQQAVCDYAGAAVARLWSDVITNSVDPGWVPTKMGGPNAPDDLRLGHQTQEWLATSNDLEVLATGGLLASQAADRIAPRFT